MNDVIIKTAEQLGDQGFVVNPNEKYIDLNLSENDSNTILDIFETEGLDGADEVVQRAGLEIETMLIANAIDPNTYFKLEGYSVDDDNKAISLRLIPKQAKVAWEKLPKGWTKESMKKFWTSLTGDAKHKIGSCMKKFKKIEGITDEGAFCASLAREMGYKPEKATEKKKKSNLKQETIAKNKTALKEFTKVQNKFKSILANMTDEKKIVTAIEILGEDVEIKDVDNVTDDIIQHLEKVDPIEKGTEIMQKYIPDTIPDTKPDTRSDAMASLKKKIDKANKEVKTAAAGFDILTDIVTGKDEGPPPTQAHEKTTKVTDKKPEHAHEPVTKKTQEQPTKAQEKTKGKKANRHLESMELIDKALAAEMIDTENKQKEYKRLVEMPDVKYSEMKMVINAAYEAKVKNNISTSVIISDGQLHDLEKILGE
jgi:hypothetical protein